MNIQANGKAVRIFSGNVEFGMHNVIETEGQAEKPVSVQVFNNTVKSIFSDCTQTDTFTKIDESYFKIEHTWAFTQAGKKRVCSFSVFPTENPDLFIPAVLFRKNEKGTGCFPKGGIEKRFAFYEDRMPLPGCVAIFNEKKIIISCLDNPKKNFKKEPALVSVFGRRNKTVCALYLSGEEYPFSYRGKTHTVTPCARKRYSIIPECSKEKPFIVTRSRFIYFADAGAGLFLHKKKFDLNTLFFAYRSFIETHILHKNIQLRCTENKTSFLDWEQWFKLKKEHLLFLSEYEKKQKKSTNREGAYIKMGKENGDIQYVYEFTGASFLIKSMEAAFVFSETKNTVLAEKIGNFFLQAEQPKLSGIFKDNHNLKTGEWGGYLGIAENKTYGIAVNARCNGEAMLSYLRLYESLLKQGIKRKDFLQLVKRVAAFYLRHQMKNGSFGRWWTADGKTVNTQGTNGAYIVCLLTALLPYCNEKEKKSMYQAVVKAAGYYCRLIERADYYGDTLDADAFDKESAVILLRMCLDLHEYTHQNEYLRYACKAADFAATWIWFYNVPFSAKTPLGKSKFLTAGMTSVSVAHHHLDFYGMYIARDFFRLSKAVNEKQNGFYGTAAQLMLSACRQLIARPETPLGKNGTMTGWQPEQINYTAWDYFDRAERQKGFFDVCIAWVPVLTLGAYLQIRSEFPEHLKEAPLFVFPAF